MRLAILSTLLALACTCTCTLPAAPAPRVRAPTYITPNQLCGSWTVVWGEAPSKVIPEWTDPDQQYQFRSDGTCQWIGLGTFTWIKGTWRIHNGELRIKTTTVRGWPGTEIYRLRKHGQDWIGFADWEEGRAWACRRNEKCLFIRRRSGGAK